MQKFSQSSSFRQWLAEMEYQYPDKSHDYDPGWDYEPHEDPDQEIDKKVQQIVGELRKGLLPQLGIFRNFTVSYASPNSMGGVLGRYVDGTVSEPVVMLDLAAIQESCEDYRLPLELGIETTIVHELGHAIQEAHDLEDDEEDAEEFARQWYQQRQVYRFWDS